MQATSAAQIVQRTHRCSYAGTIEVSIPEVEFAQSFSFSSIRPFEAAGHLCIERGGLQIFEVYGDVRTLHDDGFCASLAPDVALYAPAVLLPAIIGIRAASEGYTEVFVACLEMRYPIWQCVADGDRFTTDVRCRCELTDSRCIDYDYRCSYGWLQQEQLEASRPRRAALVG